MNQYYLLNRILHYISFKNLFIFGFITFLSIVIAFSIIMLGTFAAIFWFAVLLGTLTVSFLYSSKHNWSGELFLIGFMLYFVFWLVAKLSGISLPSLWQLLLVFGFFTIPRFVLGIKQLPYFRRGLIWFALYLLAGVISTAMGKAKFMASLYQFLSDIKIILILIIGFAIVWNARVNRYFWIFIEWFWLFCIPFIIFEWASPNAYFSVFKGQVSLDPGGGFFPSRAVGPFMLPQFLAATATMFGMLIYSRMMTNKTINIKDSLNVLAYVLLTICADQRQELIAMLIGIYAIYVLSQPGKLIRRSIYGVIALIVVVPVFWMIFSDSILKELPLWGIGTNQPAVHPRAQLYHGAFQLASQHFPLGTGLGTYGGAGAEKFDFSYYYSLGFGNYWWFKGNGYRMDTYWPNPIAETGFIGAIFLLMAFVLMTFQAFKKSIITNTEAAIYWRFCFAGMLYLLQLSLTAPAFNDPMLCYLPLLAFGIATYHEKNFNQPRAD